MVNTDEAKIKISPLSPFFILTVFVVLLRLSTAALVLLTMIYILTDDLRTPYLTLSVSRSVSQVTSSQAVAPSFMVKSWSEELQE